MAVTGVVIAAWLLAAVVVGHLAYRRFGAASDAVFAAWRVVMAVVWIMSGVALIVGGYTVAGAVLIALFWFVMVGGVVELKESEVRRELNR